MKFLRSLLAVIFILIIVGGIGYIAWSQFLAPMNHYGMNTNPNTQAPQGQNQMPHGQSSGQQVPQGNTGQNNAPLNTTAIENRDRLNQAVGTINQAIDLISIDPYSKTTLPQANPNDVGPGAVQGQGSQGNGTINIYPSGNSSVNIAPNGNNTPNNTAPPANTNQGTLNMQQNQSYVFAQDKLEQLHNGIFSISQGIMMINQLKDDLLAQSSVLEANPPNYQTYAVRYKTALQNRTKLNNAYTMLSQASTLINVNPYASPNGYSYNKDAMAKLHQGVFKLAQGMAMLSSLNEDFTNQMVQASVVLQSMMNATGHTGGTTYGISILQGIFDKVNMSTIFNIILVVLLVGLILGVLGAIMNMFGKSSTRKNEKGKLNDESSVL
ncbi:MAG: hypothetical protein N2645_06605 [Clostridia bacterium]|nr:hypothetical protein [Clostridia bacterium]